MEKHKILQELSDLLNIPQIERLMAHKIEELKNIYKDELDLYFSLRKNYQDNAYGKMYICEYEGETDTSKILQTYRFEIDKDIHNEWKITEIDPALPVGQHPDDIIPPFIINYMINFNVDATKIETINHFSHPKLNGKIYNLRFTRYSDCHILGTITEVQNTISEVPSLSTNEGTLNNLVNINDYYKNENDEFNYKELMYYLEKYPAFREHTFSEFFMKWKPLIDGNLLKLDH